MGEIVVISSDDYLTEKTNEEETMMMKMKNRVNSSEIVRWEKYLPKTAIRVLLVESDDSTRQIITALLRKCSYNVVAVSDGLAAWEILKEEEKKKKKKKIDLILTELDLPSISGFALLALVMEHEACKNIPVIMMSSQDSITMVLKCMLRGAADYLVKPMRKNELKNLWQHVWRRLSVNVSVDPSPLSLQAPASQKNLETSADSQASSNNELMADVKPLDERDGFKDSDEKLEAFDVTMDLIGGIDKQSECCLYGDKSRRDQCVGPELKLSLKRSCSGSLQNNQEESKHQKLSLSDVSAFSRYENSKPVVEASSGEPKTPSGSHEKLRNVRSDHGSATTSSNQENIGSSQTVSNNQVQKQHPQDSPFPVESNRFIACKELEVGSQSTSNSTEKPKEEGEESQQRWSQREVALMKFRMKRKDRCFDKKVRYQSRKKLAEQRPRVKGQFVRADASTKS